MAHTDTLTPRPAGEGEAGRRTLTCRIFQAANEQFLAMVHRRTVLLLATMCSYLPYCFQLVSKALNRFSR